MITSIKHWFNDILQNRPRTLTETCLQTAWGNWHNDVSMASVHKTMTALKTMDDQHGAFWVG